MTHRFLYTCLLSVLLSLGACNSGASEAGEESGHHHHGEEREGEALELSARQMEVAGITLGGIEEREMGTRVTVYGELKIRPQSEAAVSPLLGGTVSRLFVSPGEKVRKGEKVAVVKTPEVVSLREDYRIATQELELARRELNRQQSLASQGAGVRKNLEAARTALSVAQARMDACKSRMRDYGVSAEGIAGDGVPVVAPLSGTVTEVSTSIGAYADPMTPIVRIVDTSGLYCVLKVLEKDLKFVNKGSHVELSLTNDASRSFEGVLGEISPALDESRAISVSVSLPGVKDDAGLVPGMAVTGQLVLKGEKVKALPEQGVARNAGKHYVYVLENKEMENGEEMYHFEKVEVACGVTSGGYVQVTPVVELPEDAVIVTSGAFYLNSMATDHGEHSH